MKISKQNDNISPKIYSKVAGILLFISILAGVFGEIGVSWALISPGNPDITAGNILNSIALYRIGFAGYLLEAICDVVLILIFYQLLKPVNKAIALLGAFFGLISTATYASAELFYFVASLIVEGRRLSTFSQAQINELATLSITIYNYGGGIFMLFYGIASMIRGYLIFHSSYLPKILGILLAIAGLSFVIRNFLLVLAPSFASNLLLVPMLLIMLILAIYFLTKGVDIEKWEQKIALQRN